MDDKIRILLVEDNPGDTLLIKEALKKSSYRDATLFMAESLAEALKYSRENILFLLLDLSLPDSDGLDTVRQIHQHFPDSALIVLTGMEDEKVAVETLREGAQNFLTKGEIDNKVLDKTIRFSLERHQNIQKLRTVISDLKKAEEELQVAHERLVFHIENGPLGFIEWDNHLHIKSWSKRAEEIFGWTQKEFTDMAKTGYSEVYVEDQPWVFKISEQLITGEIERSKIQHRNYTKDGKVIWCEWFNSVLKDEEGKVITIMSLVQDITERKRVEETLLQSEATLKEAQALSHISNWEIDLLTNINTWSDEFYNIFRIKRGDVVPSPEAFLSFIHPEDLDCVRETVEKTFQTHEGASFTSRIKSRDDSSRYVYSEWNFEFDKDRKPFRLYGILQDITERKNAEKSEAEIQERLKAIFNGASDAILLADNSGKYVQVNSTAVKMLGYTEDELLSKTIVQISSGSDSVELWSKFLEEGHQIGAIELTRKDGKPIFCHYNSTANILPGLHLFILTDITESMRADEAVKKSEKKYRYLFENNPMPMLVVDKGNLKFLDVNEASLSHYGYTRKEFLSMTTFDILPKMQVDRYKTLLQTDSWGSYRTGIWKHLKKDNSIIDVEVIVHDIDFDQRKARLILVNDVTEKLKTEEEIKDSYQQLKELTAHLQRIREEERTHIARQIHDDLGQQLTSLKMDASWIGKKITIEDKPIQERLSGMISLIDDTIKTVRQISSDLRPGILDDLGLIPALEWQTQEFGKRTGTESHFHTDLSDINLEINLSTNIFRVYQEALTNVTRHAQATHVETTLEEKDGYVSLIIKDNGVGFDMSEVKKKTSWGLVGMKERALMFHGEIAIESEKLKGTTVILKVPLLEKDKTES